MFYFLLISNSISNEIKILYKINNSIITNQDVIEEINYLTSLNKNLDQLSKSQLSSNAQQSLIREKIKKDEIEKFYEIDYKKSAESEKIVLFFESFRDNLGFSSNEEFENYLISKELDIFKLKKKFIIERLWNRLIYDKYNHLVKIDSVKINDKLDAIIENNSDIVSFNISEIVFLEKDKKAIEDKYKEIVASINTVGFKDAAVIHSVSESSKLGGELGWVNQNQISKKVYLAIKDLEIGKFSKPIITAGGIILLNINDKKNVSAQINKEEEMKRLVSFERDRVLNEFSIIYYKEIENKAYVEKF